MSKYFDYRRVHPETHRAFPVEVADIEFCASTGWIIEGYDGARKEWVRVTPAMIAANTGPKVVRRVRFTTEDVQFGTNITYLYFWDDGVVTWKEER